MKLTCLTDPRRDAVRATQGMNGLDYVETTDSPPRLYVYFLGKLPPEFAGTAAQRLTHLRLEGAGHRSGNFRHSAQAR